MASHFGRMAPFVTDRETFALQRTFEVGRKSESTYRSRCLSPLTQRRAMVPLWGDLNNNTQHDEDSF